MDDKSEKSRRIRGIVAIDNGNGGVIRLDYWMLSFTLSSTWHSPQAPKLGQEVEVELDAHGELEGIWVLSEQQATTKLNDQ
jgi:uncharacterized protein YuzE